MTHSFNEVNLLREQVQAQADIEQATFQTSQPATTTTDHVFSDSELLQAVNADEDGDAWAFIQLHRDRLRFDHAAGSWFEWQGHYWAEDHVLENLVGVDAVINLYGEAAKRASWQRLKASKAGDYDAEKEAEKREKVYLGRVRYLQRLHHKRNVLTLAGVGRRTLGITGGEWDMHPWLLACPNGTVDLQTGKLRPGRQEDFIKTSSPTPWRDLETKAPTWLQFLTEIQDGDQEMVDFLQRLFGYSITGLTTEHVFPILWGAGRNGKGTLLQTLADVLGPLAGPIKAEMLLKHDRSRQSGSPDSDIMNLRGKRLVWASETDEGRKLNVGKIKWFCGGDTLCGREPFGRHEVQFKPTHTLLLLTNHKPKADPTDYALWQRVYLIPFTLSFVDEPRQDNECKRDPYLSERLQAEAPGILAWLVRGCLAWQKEGLKPPDKVKLATEEYRESEDDIARFISECCVVGGAGQFVKAGELFQAYTRWAETNGLQKVGGRRFGEYIKRLFNVGPRTRTGYQYLGIGLLENPERE